MFRIQDNNSILCRFYCIDFIKCMLPGNILLDYINLCSPNEYINHGKIRYKYFKDKCVKSQV